MAEVNVNAWSGLASYFFCNEQIVGYGIRADDCNSYQASVHPETTTHDVPANAWMAWFFYKSMYFRMDTN